MRIFLSYGFTRDPNNPGFCDVGMSFLLGLGLLGHECFLVEEVEPKSMLDASRKQVGFDAWEGRQRFEDLARAYGIWPRCSLIETSTGKTHGLDLPELTHHAKGATLLIVTSGRVRTPEITETIPQRAYVDINPGKTQVYHSEYGVDYGFSNYQHFLTVGLNIGTDACDLPTGGLTWTTFLPPVALDMWRPRTNGAGNRFTTISTWAGRHTFRYKGRFSGEKSDQWVRFLDLPLRASQKLEIAMNMGPGYENDARRFRENGWILSDPSRIRTLRGYKGFVWRSRGEFSVANNRYVEFNTGWFSDRSARYLASGKPVLVQSTGIEPHLPTGKGLLTFSSVEEAVAGLDAINADYPSHCETARAIAEEYFDARKVMARILEQVGLDPAAN